MLSLNVNAYKCSLFYIISEIIVQQCHSHYMYMYYEILSACLVRYE